MAAELTSEMELFFELCPADIIAVTGSDGKTTTTSLIYEMLNEAVIIVIWEEILDHRLLVRLKK